MPIRHRLRDSDTVEYLAEQYMGSSERWREIVDYNNLVYPYLSKNPEDKYKVYSSGLVKFKRASANSELIIMRNWTLKTRKNIMSSVVKTYYLVSPVVMPQGVFEAYGYVRSFVPGIQGNTSAGSLTELGDDFIQNNIMVDAVNEQAIAGGAEGFVRVTGDFIFIPGDEDVMLLEDYDARFSLEEARYFFGDDLKIVDDDLQIESTEDLATVNFVKNVEQAVNRRLTTERGDMLSDFEYGNSLASIIGDNKLPFDAKEQLLRLEILEVLADEDRISDPEITRIELVPSQLTCYVDLTMKVVNVGTELNMENIMLGGIQ